MIWRRDSTGRVSLVRRVGIPRRGRVSLAEDVDKGLASLFELRGKGEIAERSTFDTSFSTPIVTTLFDPSSAGY